MNLDKVLTRKNGSILLIVQVLCLIPLIITKNNVFLIGTVGLLPFVLICTWYPSIRAMNRKDKDN